jgi:methylaspartate mutase epsilon subunit
MEKRTDHTILLGGIGGDSHSVGLNILRHALAVSGYNVRYLGIQNRLEDFCERAPLSNVVMISSLDGHTRYYLREFPRMMERYKANKPLWYLGGNLHIGDANGYEKYFLDMGFDRVFVKFTDVRKVLSVIEQDLHGSEPMPLCPTLWEKFTPASLQISAPVADEVLDLDDFERSRRDVLDGWKTGHRAKSLEANAEFLLRQPSFPRAQAMVNEGRAKILLQPRSGVPLLSDQIKVFKAFKSCGARVLSYQVDSLTRNMNYAGAEEAIRESRASGDATLNGFPVVNHGVEGLRRIISEVKAPLQTRHSTRDPRLLAEISYAGGVTAFEGGAICYNIPYYKDYPLDESIATWQYVDRLTGLYHERYGISLDREFFGTLTATLIPPSLAIVVGIIEATLAVRQGVKCVSLGYAEQGNRNQDIAAIRTLAAMAAEIIRNLGYQDVQINTVFHQYMAAFPDDPARAEGLIYNSAITAALSGATRVILKTAAEAYRIPTMEDNLHGISLVQRGVASAAAVEVDETRVSEECAIIRREVQAILDSVIMIGRGSIAEGVVAGFRRGFIDIPFAPSIYNRAEVMTARDNEGAVRFLSTGQLQFDRDLREFHRSKMDERRRSEGLLSSKDNHLLVEKDVMQIARNDYSRWPLYG